MNPTESGKKNASVSAGFITDNRKKIAYWQTIPTSQISSIQSTPYNILNIFKATGYNLNANYGNSKCVSTMLNHNNWTDFVNTDYADYAIGGPTIEMWVASWNDMYPDDKLYCNNTGNYGYYIGTSPNPQSTGIDETTMKRKTGSKSYLYPATIQSNLLYGDAVGCWFASPSAAGAGAIIGIRYSGVIANWNYDSQYINFRPVVSLKPGTILKKTSSGNFEILENE